MKKPRKESCLYQILAFLDWPHHVNSIMVSLIICIVSVPGQTASWCPMSPHFLGEFPGYWDWLWYPGLLPMLVSFAYFPSPSISQCFSFHSSSPAIGFHFCESSLRPMYSHPF